MTYPAALALTLGLELLLVGLLVARASRTEALVACTAVNLLSHPTAAWLLVQGLDLELLEVGVLLVETVGYRLALGSRWGRAAGLALATNGVTWAVSYLV